MRRLRWLVPLGIFVVLLGFLGVGLTRDPREVPSPLVDKPAPVFRLQQLHEPQLAFTPVGDTRAQFGAFMKGEIAKWSKVAHDSGARAD